MAKWALLMVLVACGGATELDAIELEETADGQVQKQTLPPSHGMSSVICPPEAQDQGWICHWNDCASCHAGDPYYSWVRCVECQRCKHGRVNNCKPCFSDEECKEPPGSAERSVPPGADVP